jgi:nitroreductase
MNVSDAIRTKRAVRHFQDKPLPDETVRAILNAGRRAQSSKNTQPWHFVAIRDRETLKRLATLGDFAGHAAGAALAVVLVSPDPATRWSVPYDLGQAAAYMQLAAWELGIGSCIGAIYHMDKARALLGIPADLHGESFISFGYPAPNVTRPANPKGRRAMNDVTHWERW